MKKNIYITCLVIVTVLCILGGTVFHVTHWLYGSSFSLWDWGSGESLDRSRVTYAQTLDAFTDVTIEGCVFDITVQAGSEYALSYDCVAYLVPEIQLESGTLAIIQPSVSHLGSNNSCKMTLTVPAGAGLDTLTIYTDVGDIDVSGLTIGYASVAADVGDIEMENCTFTASDMAADVGEIELSRCSLGESTASCDVGDLEITSCDFISLNASADVGEISIRAAGDLSAYRIDLTTDMGSVTVNGEKYKRNFNLPGSGGSGELTAYTNLGDIDLIYE